MQTTLTSPTLWLILIPFVFVFLLLVYVATYNLLKRAVQEVTEDAIYNTVYDAIGDAIDDALKNSVSADGVHTPQLDVDVEDLADKIDKTFKLSKATYRNVKSLTED